eukprot:763141-Hanusia_phi.AAC.1
MSLSTCLRPSHPSQALLSDIHQGVTGDDLDSDEEGSCCWVCRRRPSISLPPALPPAPAPAPAPAPSPSLAPAPASTAASASASASALLLGFLLSL